MITSLVVKLSLGNNEYLVKKKYLENGKVKTISKRFKKVHN